MPAGVPVATFAIGEAGATNAALFAVALLAADDERPRRRARARIATERRAEAAQASPRARRCALSAIVPPAAIGMLGGGQLGRYALLAARLMGYRTIVLDPDRVRAGRRGRRRPPRRRRTTTAAPSTASPPSAPW